MPFINRCGGMINNFITGEFTGLGENVYENDEWIYASEYTIENVYLPSGKLSGFYIWLKNRTTTTIGTILITSSGESVENGVCYRYTIYDQEQGDIRQNEFKFAYDANTGTLHFDRLQTSGSTLAGSEFIEQPYEYIIW